jgi:hypothetical protein
MSVSQMAHFIDVAYFGGSPFGFIAGAWQTPFSSFV